MSWYICGPTVYDHAHIGHARTYIMFDLLRRVEEYVTKKPFKCVMNITDIDDKIINNSSDASFFEKEFFNDMDMLDVKRPTLVTRVTEFIPQILEFIQQIMKNGYAYESNGSVYFDLTAYKAAGFSYETSETEEVKDMEKKSSYDFALWKKTTFGKSWDSPWGKGRPGWHIECSVMASHAFNFQSIDVHGGGIDLCFPHHQNEVAQINAYHNKDIQWVKKFIHTGHLHIDGKKMSKSLKNFVTIKDLLKNISGRQARLLFYRRKYNESMTFNETLYSDVIRLDRKIAEYLFTPAKAKIESEKEELMVTFMKYVKEDYNIPELINVIHTITQGVPIFEIQETLKEILAIIGLEYTIQANPVVNNLISIRDSVKESAKKYKDKSLFELSDKIRNLLKENFKVEIIDTKDGTTIQIS